MDNPLVQPDPGLFIWTILTFLILLGLLAKFAWNPLLRALEERQEMIRNSLDDAEKTKRELLRVQQESAEIIAEARAEAQTIVSKSRAGNLRKRPTGWSTTPSGRSSRRPRARCRRSAEKW